MAMPRDWGRVPMICINIQDGLINQVQIVGRDRFESFNTRFYLYIGFFISHLHVHCHLVFSKIVAI